MGADGVAELVEETPERALGVYAHPDDPDVSCGGTLARWSREGCEVHVLLCTEGDKGTLDPSVTTAEVAKIRAAEAAEAAAIIGLAGQHHLGHSDGDLVDGVELRAEIVEWVRRLVPTVVLCPDPTALFFGEDYLNHRDHRVVGACVLDALAPAAALPHYFPEAGPPHQVKVAYLSGTLDPTVWIDITPTVGEKLSAVACHRSQFPAGFEWAREALLERAMEEGQRAGVQYAEAFRRLRLGA